MTLLHEFSGVLSNGDPHVAPAFANKMSTCWVCFETSATRRWISEGLEISAGTEMALPEKGRVFRAAQASSQAEALREVMKTLEQPAWMRLGFYVGLSAWEYDVEEKTYPDAAWRPNPLEPPVTTATLPSSEKMLLKLSSLTSASADMSAEYMNVEIPKEYVCRLKIDTKKHLPSV